MRLYILVYTQEHPTQLSLEAFHLRSLEAGWRQGYLCRGQVLSHISFLFKSGFFLENSSLAFEKKNSVNTQQHYFNV